MDEKIIARIIKMEKKKIQNKNALRNE